MNYSIVKIRFKSKARFGIRKLEDTFKICHSDTLFSALFIETKNIYGLTMAEKLKESFNEGKIQISSAMPFFYDSYEEDYKLFLPKPIVYIDKNGENKKIEVNSDSLKKVLKRIDYLEVSDIEEYLQKMSKNETSDISSYANKMIEQQLDIKVNLEQDISKTYNVASNSYLNKLENNGVDIEGYGGLYFVIKYEEETQMELIKNVLKSLQYTGIGGKRSIGYGSFNIDSITSLDKSQYYDEKVLYDLIENSDDSKYFMLISLLSPKEEEIEEFDLENIYYSLIKRGGFIYSSDYSENNQKKNDIYMLEEGSTLNKKYLGDIKNLAENGKHPVYRYGIGMYIGIKY